MNIAPKLIALLATIGKKECGQPYMAATIVFEPLWFTFYLDFKEKTWFFFYKFLFNKMKANIPMVKPIFIGAIWQILKIHINYVYLVIHGNVIL